MKQHKKNVGLSRVNLSIPKELYEWLKSTSEKPSAARGFASIRLSTSFRAKHNKTQSLYLTEILELVKKLQDHA